VGTDLDQAGTRIFEDYSINWFDFTPTFANYRVTLMGEGPAFFASRKAIVDTLIVAAGATALALLFALPASFALSRMAFKGRRGFYLWTIFQRITPPSPYWSRWYSSITRWACATRESA
jgi:ABC-type glycerol-3-phosphate transport system permease component